MALRPKTRHRRQAQAKSRMRYLRPIGKKYDEPGRKERLEAAKMTPVMRFQEQLRDRQHYRQTILERMAGRNHGNRSQMLRDRLMMVNAQIRELTTKIAQEANN